MASFDMNQALQLMQLANSFRQPRTQPQAQSQWNPFAQSQTPSRGSNPSQLFGSLGLLGLSQLGRDEPGYVTEARQNLRNLSTPQGYGSIFGQTVGGLQSQFQPYLQQQFQRGLSDISQRFTAAFPSTVGAQPQEFGAFGNYLTREFEPARQAFIGNLGLQGINQQAGAAQQILGLAQPNALNQALGTLAGIMAAGGMGTGGGGQQGGFDLGSILRGQQGQPGTGQPPGGGGFLGGGLPGNILNTILGNIGPINAAVPGGIGGLTAPAWASMFGAGGAGAGGAQAIAPFAAAENPATIAALEQALGVAPGTASGAAGAAAQQSFWTMAAGNQPGFFGPLGTAGGLLQGAGIGAAGFGAGNLIGRQLPGTELGGTAAGAGGGAAAGALIGTFIFPGIGTALGAAIGALAGGGGGFLGSQGQAHQIKAQARSADLQAAGTTEAAIEQFWTEAIGSAGADIAPFTAAAQRYGPGQVDQISAEGASQLLLSINANRPPGQGISSLDAVPGFRERYIDYIMQNTQIEQGGQAVAPSNISQKAGLLAGAGFQQPGTSGTLAVGEVANQYFANPDSPTRAEANELAGKVRAAGYTGSIPEGFYNLPGAIMNQVANGLIYSARGSPDHVPSRIFAQAGL